MMANDNGINRRKILFGGAAAAGTATLASILTGGLWSGKSQAEDGVFTITKSEEEWRRLLTEKQYFCTAPRRHRAPLHKSTER